MKCSLPGCNRVAYHKKSVLCKACYQFLYYWNKRSVTDKMRHVHKVGQWNERVAALVPLKVAQLRRKK